MAEYKSQRYFLNPQEYKKLMNKRDELQELWDQYNEGKQRKMEEKYSNYTPGIILEGTKHDTGKTRLELIPPELLFAVGDILTFGAKKYTKTKWSKFWNYANVKRQDLYIAGDYVVGVTRNNSGKIILHTPNVNEKIGENGNVKTQTEYVTWQEAEQKIQSLASGMLQLSGETIYQSLDSQSHLITNSWNEVVKFVVQSNTCTLITTTLQENSEVYCAVNTTMVSDSLATTLKVLKPQFATLNLSPETGDRNWEQGMKWSRVYGALMRHLWTWWKGEQTDPETGKSHLWHAGCCIAFLIAYEERKVGEDDRPK